MVSEDFTLAFVCIDSVKTLKSYSMLDTRGNKIDFTKIFGKQTVKLFICLQLELYNF